MSVEGVSPIPREARPFQGQPAGLVSRLVAAAIDAAVVAAVLVAGYLGLCGLKFMVDPRSFSFPDTSLLISLTAGLVVAVVYLALAWAIGGRTYGCHVMGLRVLNHRGRHLRPAGALARALFCVFFPIGLLWCAASRTQRSVQDAVLRTSVVYDWQPHVPGADDHHLTLEPDD